jgi:hypothetical protein
MKRKIVACFVVLIITGLFSCKNTTSGIGEIKLIPVQSGEIYQYIDQDGKIIINPQFSQATIFRNGVALVRTSGDEQKWGYISEDGKYAVPATFTEATVFSEDLAWVVSENAPPKAINSKGEIKITLQDAQTVYNFKEGLAAYCNTDSSTNMWGFIDKEGKVKIAPQFTGASDFSGGKCSIRSNGKWGYIDKQGKIIINCQFDDAGRFMNGFAVVSSGEKVGVIDENGKYIINPQFSEMIHDGEKYLVKQGNKWGWCDGEGKMIINPQFDYAFPFLGNKLAPVKSGNNFGYIDMDGKIVINPQFDWALPFNGNIALVRSGDKIGFIDIQGKYTINPQFDGTSSDLVAYLLKEFTGLKDKEIHDFTSVHSDYFNMNAIVQKVTKDITESTVCDISFNTPIATIFKRFNIAGDPNYYFSISNQSAKLISEKRISDDASFDVKMDVMPINLAPELEGFTYTLNLKRKAYDKSDELFKALEKSFSGYSKDNAQSRSDYVVLKGHQLAITLNKTPGHIEINIETLASRQRLEQMPGD